MMFEATCRQLTSSTDKAGKYVKAIKLSCRQSRNKQISQ